MSIKLDNISFAYGKHEVLRDVSFSADDGNLVAVLGPNGVGKSTLFKCMLGSLQPQKGSVYVNGKAIKELDFRQMAKEIAYIPQTCIPAYNYTVAEVVLMGVASQLGKFDSPKAYHREQAHEILVSLGMDRLENRGVLEISGGERQLVLLARALLQNARVLLMDEPTANLDYGNQFRVMERISGLADSGYTVIFSTHNPNQALMHAHRVFVLKDGRTLADGAPKEVLTAETLSELYGINVLRHEIAAEGENISICLPSAGRSRT